MLNTIDQQDSKQWYKYDIIINRVFNKKYDNLFVWNVNYYLTTKEFIATKGWYRSGDQYVWEVQKEILFVCFYMHVILYC